MEHTGVVQQLLEFVRAHADGLGGVVLFLASLIEYVFPPFPGDVLTLLGAWLVVQGLWSFPLALAVVTAGSLVGATIDYLLGRWLGDRWPRSRWLPSRKELERALVAFRRWGPWLIAINRFLPGIRAFFFLAAGMSRMSLGLVLALALVSALAWNSLLLGAGWVVGSNWERLRQWLSTYTNVAWAIVAGVASCLIVYYLIRSRKKPRSGGGENK